MSEFWEKEAQKRIQRDLSSILILVQDNPKDYDNEKMFWTVAETIDLAIDDIKKMRLKMKIEELEFLV